MRKEHGISGGRNSILRSQNSGLREYLKPPDQGNETEKQNRTAQNKANQMQKLLPDDEAETSPSL
jgi:hypothetical protein